MKHFWILKQLSWFTTHGLIQCRFESFFCFLKGDTFFHATDKLVQSRFFFFSWILKSSSHTSQRHLWKIRILPGKIYTEVGYRPRKGKPRLRMKNSIISFFCGFLVMLCCRFPQFSLPGPSFLLVHQGFWGAVKINQVRLAVFSSTLHDGCSQKTHASECFCSHWGWDLNKHWHWQCNSAWSWY